MASWRSRLASRFYLGFDVKVFVLPGKDSSLLPEGSGRRSSLRRIDLEAADDGAVGPLGEGDGGQVQLGLDLSVLTDEALVIRHVENPFLKPRSSGVREKTRAVSVDCLKSRNHELFENSYS